MSLDVCDNLVVVDDLRRSVDQRKAAADDRDHAIPSQRPAGLLNGLDGTRKRSDERVQNSLPSYVCGRWDGDTRNCSECRD